MGIVADSPTPLSFAHRRGRGRPGLLVVSSKTILASMFLALIVSRPTLTGSWNRFGPALPGLK
jgi:hypothetical protein